VGLYQLEYSKTAPHAVVDNAVSVSRAFGRGKSAFGVQGLVNAVLRNFIRNRSDLLERVAESEIGRYSHPQWWIDKLRAQYPQNYKAILENSNKRPPMTLRVNRRRVMIAEYQNLLSQSGMDAWPAGNDALELRQPVAVDRLPGFAEGLISVQDAGAQMAAQLLDVRDCMRVLDACAAPGGKSAHLLELADIELTAVDNDIARVARITQNFTRLDLKANHIIHGNASQPAEWWDGKLFDRILADVPCSASGVTRRHPDI
jgi:16S rRNA (cytosine967-C5)-methyltransferase